MSKDPAVLLYTSDFLSGCQDLTMMERGQYITLLCLQHQKGVLSPKIIKLTCGNEMSQDVLDKFKIDKDGNYYNERMNFERNKRKAHSELQRQKAQLRWDKVKKEKNNLNKQPKGDAVASSVACAVALPLENENENENKNKDKSVNKIVFPFSDESFFNAWNQWKQYKKDIKKPYKSKLSEQAALKRIGKMANDSSDAIDIIEYSIAQAYQGLYKENKTNNNGGKNNTNQSKYSTGFKEYVNEAIQSS